MNTRFIPVEPGTYKARRAWVRQEELRDVEVHFVNGELRAFATADGPDTPLTAWAWFNEPV